MRETVVDKPRASRGALATVALIAALVALWVIPMLVAPRVGDEPFAGTDAQATEMVTESGYQPWFSPIFEPSGEIESGLFALQAAMGAGVLFYVLGYFHGRTRAERARAGQDRSDGEA